MKNRIRVLENAVVYCLTTIKELEGYIGTKAAENKEVVDAEQVVVE
jgi:hypothetical protein